MHTHSTTRVIEDCANPVWKETFFHKIPDLDMLDEHIRFRLKVMDWDRFTSDDHIGSIWFDIKDAIGNGEREILIHDGYEF
jgi:Ca2+-dependent lipid-binding protein